MTERRRRVDPGPLILSERVLESADVLRGPEVQVTDRLYPGLGHTLNGEEIDVVRAMIALPGRR